MADRTYECRSCGAIEETPGLCGRMPQYCDPCRQERKNARQRAERAAVRVAPTACRQCGGPMPEGCRADAKWCGKACQSFNQRRRVGQVAENTNTCASCGDSLAGLYANAKSCRKPRCRGWVQRHPGVTHPAAQPRVCGQCGNSIDHLNGKGKWCGAACQQAAARNVDRESYNERARLWQSSEKGRSYRQAYQKANAEERQRWARADRARNPERYYGYWKQWAAANPGLVREQGHIRRARKLGNPGSVGVSLRDWQRLVRRYRGCCAYCGKVAEPLHMDHVIPLAKGGRHAIGNVLPACGKCNVRKHAMLLAFWRYRRAWLAA